MPSRDTAPRPEASAQAEAWRPESAHIDDGTTGFDPYRRRLRELRTVFEALASIAAEVGEVDIAQSAQEWTKKLALPTFRIAFVGEFKAGKSTLLNALIGRDLLPSAARECTSVITRVRSAPANAGVHATAIDRRGLRREVPPDELATVLTHRSVGPDAIVELEYALPSATAFGADVELVDTPGTHASGLAREKVTVAWLPRSDAIVFVTRCDQLLSASEEHFIRTHIATLEGRKLIVVVNHADKIATKNEREALRHRVTTRLMDIFPAPVDVYFTSAGDAMDAIEALIEVQGLGGPSDTAAAESALLQRSGVPQLRDGLLTYLREERAEAEVQRATHRARQLAALLRRRLEGALAEVRLSGAARVRQRERAEELTAALHQLNTTWAQEVQLRTQRLFEAIAAQVEQAAQRLREDLVRAGGVDAARWAIETASATTNARAAARLRAEVDGLRRELALAVSALVDDVSAIDAVSLEQGFEVEAERLLATARAPTPSGTGVEHGAAALFAFAALFLDGGLGIIAAIAGGLSLAAGGQGASRAPSLTTVEAEETARRFRAAFQNNARDAVDQTRVALMGGLNETLRSAIRQVRQRAARLGQEAGADPNREAALLQAQDALNAVAA